MACRSPLLLLASVSFLVASAGACGAHPSDGTTAASEDGGPLGSSDLPTATEGGSASDDDAAPPPASIRILHASPDAPAIDVCVAAHGSGTFEGPLLGLLAASLAASAGTPDDASGAAAAPPGLSYAQVSAYLPLDVTLFDVRIVLAGSPTCSSLANFTDLPPLAAGSFATLVVAGDWAPPAGEPPLGVTLLGDDTALTGGAAALRAINAMASEPPLDFGLGVDGGWLPLFTGVRFGAAGAQAGPTGGVPDANGYLPVAPMLGQAFSARASSSDAGSDVASASGIEIDPGSIATIVAIGSAARAPTHPPALLLCTDNQPSGGLLSDCSVEP
jgi:Domain of unknown function (DUF4397)